MLSEIWRSSWSIFPDVAQVYIVRNRTAGIIRAYHAHEHLWDGFCIINGSAKFHLWTIKAYCGYSENLEAHKYRSNRDETVILDSRRPQLLIVPPGWMHGWCSLEDNTILLSLASHEYNHSEPDEFRVSPDRLSLGEYQDGLYQWSPIAR